MMVRVFSCPGASARSLDLFKHHGALDIWVCIQPLVRGLRNVKMSPNSYISITRTTHANRKRTDFSTNIFEVVNNSLFSRLMLEIDRLWISAGRSRADKPWPNIVATVGHVSLFAEGR